MFFLLFILYLIIDNISIEKEKQEGILILFSLSKYVFLIYEIILKISFKKNFKKSIDKLENQ